MPAAPASAGPARSASVRRPRSHPHVALRHGDERLLEVGAGDLELMKLDTAPKQLTENLLRLAGEEPDAMVVDDLRVQGKTVELALVAWARRRERDPLAGDLGLDGSRTCVGDNPALRSEERRVGKECICG